jgi:hypothetical protein
MLTPEMPSVNQSRRIAVKIAMTTAISIRPIRMGLVMTCAFGPGFLIAAYSICWFAGITLAASMLDMVDSF